MGWPGILGVVLLTGGSADRTRYEVMVGSYGPRTEVLFARPTLKWEVWPASGSDRFQDVEMKIDGKAVDARYDESEHAVTYTPDRPLAPGPHKISCRVNMGRDVHFDQVWEARISPDALPDLPSPLASQIEAVAAINNIRRALDLPTIHGDDRMNAAALQHSRYLSRNHAFGHDEDPSKPGYFGTDTAARLAAYGWVGGCWEDVSFGTMTASESVHDLFDAPYHRIPFLQPGSFSCGAGFVDQRLTLDFGMSAATGVVVSPADGQKDIPYTWRDYESPNPLRLYGKVDGPIGYPIVLGKFGSRGQRLVVSAASLTGPDGTAIPFWLNTSGNDDFLTNAAILIPKHPLKPGTSYHYSFSLAEGGRETLKEGTFMTAARQ